MSALQPAIQPTDPPATPVADAADPRASKLLMIATYALGSAALFTSFLNRPDHPTAAAYWAAAGTVGTVGVLSFVRHSVFHRSDAARMGWDYGRRNDFQIEVGFANLAWGVIGILTWAMAWGPSAAGAVTISFGIYMVCGAALHASELRAPADHGGGRPGPVIAAGAFGVMLVVAGALAVS